MGILKWLLLSFTKNPSHRFRPLEQRIEVKINMVIDSAGNLLLPSAVRGYLLEHGCQVVCEPDLYRFPAHYTITHLPDNMVIHGPVYNFMLYPARTIDGITDLTTWFCKVQENYSF